MRNGNDYLLMKRQLVLISAIALLGSGSCNTEKDTKNDLLSDCEQISIIATNLPEGTRTTVIDGGVEVFWQNGDEIKLFKGGNGTKLSAEISTLSKIATFIGASPEGDGEYIAMYPFNEETVADDSGVTFSLLSEQTAVAGSFAQNTYVTMGHSLTTEMGFYAVCGGFRFTVSQEGINRIVFESIGGEQITGKATASFKNERPEIVSKADVEASSITLCAPEGESFLPDTWYYIVALPTELEKGFKVTFYRDGLWGRKEFPSSVTIKRGVFGSKENIDSSVSYTEHDEGCYQIPSEDLNGWDKGVLNYMNSEDDFYVVTKTGIEEDGIESMIVCLNLLGNSNIEDAMYFQFGDGYLMDVFISGFKFSVQSYSDSGEMEFSVYNESDEFVESFSVPYDISERNTGPYLYSQQTRAGLPDVIQQIRIPKIASFARKAESILKLGGNAYNALSVVSLLFNEKYDGVILGVIVGAVVGTLDWPVVAAIFAEESARALITSIYESFVSYYLGDAGIEILSIKRTSDKAITVEGTVTNLRSIPNYVMVDSEQHENSVSWGIAVGDSGWPGYYLNDSCSPLFPVSLESDGSFSYTFEIETVPGRVLFFRPFLFPNARSTSFFQRIATLIRYGGRKEFLDFSIEMLHPEQEGCLEDNDGKYQIGFTFRSSIPGVFDDLSNWGIDVKASSSSRRLYANTGNDYYPPTQKSFIISMFLEEEDFTEVINDEKYALLSITPFICYRNQLPSMVFFETEHVRIVYPHPLCPDNNHPHMIDLGLPSGIKWSCCNVGASRPNDYGEYYSWAMTTPYWPGQEYPYGHYEHDDFFDEDYWVFDIVDIDSSRDAAHAALGGNWRIPTYEEEYELITTAHSLWKTVNGVNGRQFTVHNGNSIFIPAAGYQWWEVEWSDLSEDYYIVNRLVDQGITGRYPSTTRAFDDCGWGMNFSASRLHFTATAVPLEAYPVRPVTK